MMNEIFVSTFLLSITGGFVSLIFIMTEKYIYKFTSAKFIVFINALIIFTFALPLHKILSLLDQSSSVFSNLGVAMIIPKKSDADMFYVFLSNYKVTDIIINIWTLGIFVYLFFEIFLYYNFIRNIKLNSYTVIHKLWNETLSLICTEKGILDNIQLVANVKIDQPCVTGILKNYIIIPAALLNKMNSSEIEIILRHELMHITKKDIPLKILVMVLNSLNWFNPLFYILKQNLFEWTEMRCDEELVLPLEISQRKAYMHALIKMMDEEDNRKGKRYIICFGDKNVKTLKRRIYGIMKKTNHKGNFIAKILISAIGIIVVSTGTVLAKEADVPVHSIFSENLEVMYEHEFEVVNDSVDKSIYYDVNSEAIIKKIDTNLLEPFSMNNQDMLQYEIITSDGKILNIANNSNASSRHQHKFEDVNVAEHKKLSNGSCQTTYYEAVHCTVCDTYWIGDVIKESTDNPCDH